MTDQREPRSLIVNADDFGMSAGVNRGILEAHRHGIVTSASLMVRWDAAAEAATLSQSCPRLNVGLHVDLGEWAFENGQWVPLYEVVDCDDPVAVSQEVETQLNAFRKLMGRDPTHLDSHQHVHRNQPLLSVMLKLARDLAIPLRHFSDDVDYRGDFYGQTATGEPLPESIGAIALMEVLRSLPPGITELGCHPGLDDNLKTMYRQERSQEVSTLCDERVRRAIETGGIQLISFDGIPRRIPPLGTASVAKQGALACEN